MVDESIRGLTEFGKCLLPSPLIKNPDEGGKTPGGDAGIHGSYSCGLTDAAAVYIRLEPGEKQALKQLVEELNDAADVGIGAGRTGRGYC